MRKKLLLIVILTMPLAAFAQQRTLEKMASIACDCLSSLRVHGTSNAKGNVSSVARVKLKAMSSEVTTVATTSNEAFAIYAPQDEKGFVIVSTSEKMPEILAVSADQEFDTDNGLNTALLSLLNSYSYASELIESGAATAKQIFGSSDKLTDTGTETVKGPLMNVLYDQGFPYNIKCPIYEGSCSVTGCVATSMSELMAYYKYPACGTSSVTYTSVSKYDSSRTTDITCDFTQHPFTWSTMLDTYTGYSDESKTVNVTSDVIFRFNTSKSTSEGYGLNTIPDNNTQLRAAYLYNKSGTTFTGYRQLILLDANYKPVRHASLPKETTRESNYGYGTTPANFTLNLPADVADGTYYIGIGFTTDSINYSLAKVSYSNTDNYYLEATKNGNVYTIQGKDFAVTNTKAQVDQVADLMAVCGAAVQARYDPAGTSASSFDAWTAMNNYFGYDTDVYEVGNGVATTDQLCALVKKMLDANHIVPVSGSPEPDADGNATGHSYLIDGYNLTEEEPRFHINWGWNGKSNADFLLTMMKPSEAGEGGSEVNYSYDSNFFLNVFPENNTTDEVGALSAESIVPSSTTVTQGEQVSVNVTKLKNQNLVKDITGKLYCYFVSSDGKKYKTNRYFTSSEGSLPARKSFTGTKNITIPNTLPDGTYHVEFYPEEQTDFPFYCINNSNIIVGDVSAVNEVKSDNRQENSENYDLSGRHVNKTAKGIVISDGRKILR